MNFNSLFFPAPRDHYSIITHYGEMIFIPKEHELIKDDFTGEDKPILITNNPNVSSSASHS